MSLREYEIQIDLASCLSGNLANKQALKCKLKWEKYEKKLANSLLQQIISWKIISKINL